MSGMPASAPFAVFISHKSQDAEMARRLKAVLSSHAPKVNVFLSEEIPPGDHWHDRIEEALRATHWFLLLYTSSDHNWGWCLYEAGLFDGSCTPGDPDRRRICMHHPDEPPPAQFATRQSSFVDRAGVKDFLKTFFLKAGQVPETPLDKIADEILPLLKAPSRNLFEGDRFWIEIPDRAAMRDGSVGPAVVVRGDRALFQKVFGLGCEGSIPWEEFAAQFRDLPNELWIRELAGAIYAACHEKRVVPLQALVYNEHTNARYRPVLNRIEQRYDGVTLCEVVLAPEVGGLLRNVDPKEAALLTSLRMAYRMRFDFIDQFCGFPRVKSTRSSRQEMRNALLNIIVEARTRGNLNDAKQIMDGFSSRADRRAVKAMFEEWDSLAEKFWEAIKFDPVAHVWKVDKTYPLDDDEIEQLEEVLEKMDRINAGYLRLAIAEVHRRAEARFAPAESEAPVGITIAQPPPRARAAGPQVRRSGAERSRASARTASSRPADSEAPLAAATVRGENEKY